MNRIKSTIPSEAKKVFVGVMFETFQWEQEMYNGTFQTFEKLRRADTVLIVAVTERGTFLLLDQEQPNKSRFLGFAGGQVHTGEEIEVAAHRELLEETGYISNDLVLLSAGQPISKIDWSVYLFVARNCKKIAKQALDAGEKITVLEKTFDEIVHAIINNELYDIEFSSIVLRALLDPAKMQSLQEKLTNPL